ncbi:MAG: EamA family transporter, partial [Rhizobiales bacterium]|nr:EamA family transporter [Hyphomicrobiales bacterium]
MALIDWMRLLALAALWGCSYLFIEIALVSASPITIVFCRIVIAAACLVAYCAVIGVRIQLTGALIASFFVMGILNNVVPFNLIAWGQTHITGGVASIFNATTPLFTVIVAHLWPGGERATPARIAGVIIGFVGVLVLIGLGDLGDVSRELPGQAAMLLAAVSYAFSALYGRR